MEPKKFFHFPDSEFFKDGNELCCLRSVLCAKQELLVDNLTGSKSRQFGCEHAGCSEVFVNESDYQGHCLSKHAFKCMSCKRTYPSAHLLDLHIAENHNPMQTVPFVCASFRCFVPSCSEVFPSPSDRRNHCMIIHKFPPDFRYDTRNAKKASTEMCDVSTSALSTQERTAGLPSRSSAVPNRVTFGKGIRSFNRRTKVQTEANAAPFDEPMSMDTS